MGKTLEMELPAKNSVKPTASKGKPGTTSNSSKGSGKKSSENGSQKVKPKPSLSIVNPKKSVFMPMSNGTLSSLEVTNSQQSSHGSIASAAANVSSGKASSSSKQKSVAIDTDSDADDFDLTASSNLRTPQSRPARQSAKRSVPIIDSDSDESLDFGEESDEPPPKKRHSQPADDSEIVLLDD